MNNILRLVVVLILCFIDACAHNKEPVFIKQGIDASVLETMMKRHKYKKYRKDDDHLYFYYKPLHPLNPIHHTWLDSYYGFILKNNKVVEIYWYDKNGKILGEDIKELQIQ